jgi:hypothetical protein
MAKTSSKRTKRATSPKSKNKFFNFNLGTAFVNDDFVDCVLYAIPAPSSDGRYRIRVWLEAPEGANYPAVQGSLLLSKKKAVDDDDDDDDE